MLNKINRRTLLVSGCSLLTSACIESPVIGSALQTAKALAFGYPDLPLKRTTVRKIPYASMTARVGDGPQALLILGRIAGGEHHWVSGVDRSILALTAGRITRTFGFPENLKNTSSPYPDPISKNLNDLPAPIKHVRYLDFDKDHEYGMPITSTIEKLGPEEIEILELKFQTTLFVEHNKALTVPWTFTNFYWVDPADGFVWKSEQHVSRYFPVVKFEILKPPAAQS